MPRGDPSSRLLPQGRYRGRAPSWPHPAQRARGSRCKLLKNRERKKEEKKKKEEEEEEEEEEE